MTTAIIMFIVLVLLCMTISFGIACLATWAFCFIAGVLGIAISFSWRLVLAIWIVISIFNSATTVKIKEKY